jgi:dTDP-4-amino-4,6-dideoxygalactose transaminase
MNKLIPRIALKVSANHEKEIVKAIRNGHFVTGPHIEIVKKKLSCLFQKSHVVLTVNGFSSLFLALKSLNLPKKFPVDTVAAGTCFAMVNAIKAAELKCNYVDLETKTLSMKSINLDTKNKRKVSVVPDHFGMISKILVNSSTSSKSITIEDGSQSFYTRQSQKTNASIIVFSFYPTKWVNGINGGAILTNNIEYYSKIKRMAEYSSQYYSESGIRYNLQMPNLNAAFLSVTLKNNKKNIKRLSTIHDKIKKSIQSVGLETFPSNSCDTPTRLIILCNTKTDRDYLLKYLKKNNIEATKELCWLVPNNKRKYFPTARALINQTLSIPFHPCLKPAEIKKMQDVFLKYDCKRI